MAAWITRRVLIVAASLVALLGLYALAGFECVPRLLRSQAQEFVLDKYQRQLALGEIRFNPFTLALEVRDLSLPDADGAPLFAFDRLLVNLDLSSLWRRGASFSAIEIERPDAQVVIRADGRPNLADLATPFAAQPGAAAEPAGKPARIFIDRLTISGGQAGFEDRSRSSPFRVQLQPISFQLEDFSTAGGSGNHYDLRGQSASGERFEWQGSFTLEPLSSRGRFTLADVQARTLWTYLRDSLGFEIASGVIGFDGDYEFAARPTVVELKSTVHHFAVTDLGIRPPGAAEDYLRLDDLRVDATQLDLARRSVTAGRIALHGALVNAWRDAQGTINLQSLLATPATGEVAGPQPVVTTSGRERAWILAAPDIAIHGLRVALEDRQLTPAAAFTLEPVNLQVNGFSTAPAAALDITADAGINGLGKFTTQLSFVPDTGAARGKLDLAALDLTAMQPYLDRYTQLKLLGGLLATRLDFERGATGALAVKGEAGVTKLRSIDKALQQDFIKWDELRVAGIDYRSEPARLRIGTITARAPYARVVIAQDQSVNVARVLSTPGDTAVPPPAAARAAAGTPAKATAPAALPVSVGTVRIVDAAANLSDFWIQPNYAVSVLGLNGSIVGLSSDPASRAKLVLDGKVDRYAPAHIEGDINLLSASLYSDIKMNFKGVELTSVTPYAGHFAGYKIEKGKLSVDLAYHVQNRQLKADNRFVIDQLQLGERVESPDAIKLPLKIAIALLKDRNGVIDVGLPITGSLDDPQFRVGPIIWKAVLNLLVKVVTAPFALLGDLFGGGEEMNLIEFAPGSANLDATGREKLAGLLRALQERPQLQLDVPMAFSRPLDGGVLAAQRLTAKLSALAQQAAGRKPPDDATLAATLADPQKRYGLLVAQHRLDFGKDGVLPPGAQAIEAAKKKKGAVVDFGTANAELEVTLAAKQAVSDGELEELGKQRANIVQDALLAGGQVEASRVFIIGTTPAAGKDAAATTDKVRLEMSLK